MKSSLGDAEGCSSLGSQQTPFLLKTAVLCELQVRSTEQVGPGPGPRLSTETKYLQLQTENCRHLASVFVMSAYKVFH